MLKVLRGLRLRFAGGALIKDRAEFDTLLVTTFKDAGVVLDSVLEAALLAPGMRLALIGHAALVAHGMSRAPQQPLVVMVITGGELVA